jgi:1-acyl-sn-glycerol-3-phosphate acyltransferase
LLYKLLHFPAKLAMFIWCRYLVIKNKEILKLQGPLLIAANHPNSFLDAILLCSLFKSPIYSLARGDAFKNKLVHKIFLSLNMFPVYRVSEGVENLEENYKTFDECIAVFKKNGIVLIFSEGKCINEWHLRHLKKGTARLAITAWEQGIPLKVIPLGINYQSFKSFGKNIFLNFGNYISRQDLPFTEKDSSGNKIHLFNNTLKLALQNLVLEINADDTTTIQSTFQQKVSTAKKLLLFLPAFAGYILHTPLYIPIQKFALKKFGKIDHYDSVIIGMLFLLYPLYLIAVAMIVYYFFGMWWPAVFIILPFSALSYVKIKKQF